jgi:hypothetical protein
MQPLQSKPVPSGGRGVRVSKTGCLFDIVLWCRSTKEIVAFDEGLFFSFKEVIEFIPHLCSQNKDLQALQARAA